ncbi:MAG: hypothetical protein ACLFM7_06040 [Bacteroidales bacterium]
MPSDRLKNRFYDANMECTAEAREFKVFAATSSADVLETEFELVRE